eukprot:4280854-Pyramimonas_sp.AAC.1
MCPGVGMLRPERVLAIDRAERWSSDASGCYIPNEYLRYRYPDDLTSQGAVGLARLASGAGPTAAMLAQEYALFPPVIGSHRQWYSGVAPVIKTNERPNDPIGSGRLTSLLANHSSQPEDNIGYPRPATTLRPAYINVSTWAVK